MKRWFYVMLCVLLGGCVIPQRQYNPSLDTLNTTLPAAANGDTKAQTNLAPYLKQPSHWLLPSLPDTSYRWLLAAAEAGDSGAQVSMSFEYEGAYSKYDPTALYWLKRAARQGERSAYEHLALWNEGRSSLMMDAVEKCQWMLLAGWKWKCDELNLNAEQLAQAQTRADAWRANIKPEKPGNQAHGN